MNPSDPVEQLKAASMKLDEAYWRGVCRERRFPDEYWDAVSRAGLFGFLVGKERGGLGGSLLELARATLATARHYSGLGSYLFLSGCLMAKTFETVAEGRLREEMLPKLLAGRFKISVALAEEESGLDALAVKTTARQTGGRYLLTGSKSFVTNADRADRLAVFARVGAGADAGLTVLLADPQSASVRLTRLEKIGMEFISVFRVDFENTEVPANEMLGAVGQGWARMRSIFTMDRILTASSLIGTGWLALDHASAYASRRRVFGKVVGSNQGIQFPLADAASRLMGAEAMTSKAAALADEGSEFANEANIALLQAQVSSSLATDRAVQALGGHGYLLDGDVGRYWKDVRVHRVHPISEELLLASIAARVLGLPKSY